MDFKQLEYIITIAEKRTLLAASEKLSLSPSALSQYISRLEAELRISLFRRTKNGWLPTYAGQVYIDMARDVLQRQNRAYLQLSDLAGDRIGHFSVGVTPGRGARMFSSVFPQFKAVYPNVKIGLFVGTIAETLEMITTGKLDMGFVTDGFTNPEISVRSLVREEFIMVVPRSHPLAYLATQAPKDQLATVDLTRFRDDEFILGPAGTTMRKIANRAFNEAGFAPNIALESHNLETLNMLTKGGFGITFLPAFYAQRSDEAVCFAPNPPMFWEQVVAYRKDSYITEAEDFLISLAENYYKSPRSIG